MAVRPLIEQWFPAEKVGAESLRERGSAKAFPPINFLHVWWARRPLIASRAAVLASMLPAWPSDSDLAVDQAAQRVRDALCAEFPEGETAYRDWFVRVIGIVGDPVAGRAAIAAAVALGEKTQGNAYGYDRAFTVNPSSSELERARRLISARTGVVDPTVLDPFSGGGAIPFEAARLGFDTIANELNPVAVAILNGTVVLPATLGTGFSAEIKSRGEQWSARVAKALGPYFPHVDADEQLAYIWARTVPCPSTGRPTPLMPDCWLSRGAHNAAIEMHPDSTTGELSITIAEGDAAVGVGGRSTYKRGTGESVWTAETFNGDYIRDVGQSGRMGAMLLAVSVTRPGLRGRAFRLPSQADLDAAAAAAEAVDKNLTRWEIEDLAPTEDLPSGWKTDEPRRIGITTWRDMFSPRQLLTAVTAVEELRHVIAEAKEEIGSKRAKALNLYLAFALDKALDYNSTFSSWHSSRQMVRNLFDRHDFSVKWSFAEFDGASALIPWAVNNAVMNHKKISALVVEEKTMFSAAREASARVIWGSATSLPLDDESVDAVITDPPYYDNVMYAELSDFFYVWLKRSLRDTWPELTSQVLTDKEEEAVANPSLFRDVAATAKGRKAPGQKSASDLADERYEQLLTQAFRESHRVLRPDGVMTVMFTHKRVDAWDTLGQALLQAGFSVNSSWPVHTESENSLHQANKNAAASTIFLTCRRRGATRPAYWSDIRGDVAKAAREAADQLARDGMHGIDLTLATFGPALAVLSRNWPVYTGELDADGNSQILRPDVALNLAREEVARLKKRGLLGGRDVEFDRITDWYLLAWLDFRAAEFPAGEALKLSLATHLELEDLSRQHKIVRATSGSVTILTPAQRRTANALETDAATWPTMLDALHALMLTYDEDGLAAARAWLDRTGRADDAKFHDLVAASISAIPRTRDKGEFVRPEARILEGLRATLFDEIPAPVDVAAEVFAQPELFGA
jgi:putative DNA methylase